MIATRISPLHEVRIEYDRFLARCENSLVYHSRPYLEAISSISSSNVDILIVQDQSCWSAAMPLFSLYDGDHYVVNSSPYFGSHGDLLIAGAQNKAAVCVAASRALADIASDRRCLSINIVSHPTDPVIGDYLSEAGLSQWDVRTGQISRLRTALTRDEAEISIMNNCSQKTRNIIRKSNSQGFDITLSDSHVDWSNLYNYHRVSMQSIGGKYKTESEFNVLRSLPAEMRRLHVAYRGEEFCGALLTLWYNEWVEYFTPVSHPDFRNLQVGSALIAHVMAEAILDRKEYWNWGGTWSTQTGVYHFKAGWGASDHKYVYYGTAKPGVLDSDPQALLARFPYFYVRPFG